VFEVEITDRKTWDALVVEVEQHGAVMFPRNGSADLQPFATMEVVLRRQSSEIVRATGTIVHLSDENVVFSFEHAERERLVSAAFAAGGTRSGASDKGDSEQPLWVRYETLSKPERIKLARRGNADARRMVLKDRDQSLHIHIIGNPGLTTSELARLIRAGVNAKMLEQITRQDRFMNNPSVIEALVRNPFTPIKLAISLVPKLRKEIVKRIAKRGNLRAPIVSAARKVVLRR
jgi:hypothetical protein